MMAIRREANSDGHDAPPEQPAMDHEILAQLVDAAYDATIDPQRYETLLKCWESFLQSRAAAGSEAIDTLLARLASGDEPFAAAVTSHFQRAMEIFERIGRARRMEAEAQALADGMPTLGFVVDVTGRVAALNAAARHLAEERPPRETGQARRTEPISITDLAIEPVAARRVLDWIRGRTARASAPYFLMPCRIGEDQTRSCLIAAPIVGVRVDAGSGGAPLTGPLFLITSIDLNLDKEVTEAFVNAFELSAAEGAIAAALARGDRPADIAEDREASINTVRSQINSATKKTGAEGAADLARMFSGFAASYSAARAIGQTAEHRLEPHALRRHGTATLPSGRRIGYIEQGSATGRPALFVHSLCFGPYWSNRAIEAAARRRWRLIGPWRPGFGDTDPSPQRELEETLTAAVSDMRRLLDRLEIERTLLVSHQTASIYALRLAQAAPERVRGVLCLNHLPLWRDDCLRFFTPRVRLIARTARYAPKLLPFLTRAALAMIDAGDEARLARSLFAGAPHELKAIESLEVFAPLAEGLVGCMRQGTEAFTRDVMIGFNNYAAEMQNIAAPIRVLYGALDPMMPPEMFEDAEALAPRLEKTRLADAGSTLLYTHWQTVLDHLERLDAETA